MRLDLRRGDCLEVLKEIPEGSVDLILTDPPYGTIGGLEKGLEGWQGISLSWDQCLDTERMLSECNRVLRGGGRLVLFGQEPYTSRLITFKGSPEANNLVFNYRAIWLKDHFGNPLAAKKAPVQIFEDIAVFTKKYEWNLCNPLRAYSREMQQFIGKDSKAVEKDLGHRKHEHFFRADTTQFSLPTAETYAQLDALYGVNKMPGFIPYDELRRQYGDHTKRLKPTFNLEPGSKHRSNVFHYPKEARGIHPTQKPVALMRDLVRAFSNPGDTVLDFTMGSGSTGVACIEERRDFIGIELDPDFFAKASARLEAAKAKL